MVPSLDKSSINHSDKKIKVVHVIGGKEGDPMWEGSKIDSVSFKSALHIALQNSQVLYLADANQATDYSLSVLLLYQEQPSFGLDMTVSLTVRYYITDNKTDKTIWTKDIPTSFTATMGDAFVGATRLTMANEGAVRENIKSFIIELSKLKL
jgi:hypothetical protein